MLPRKNDIRRDIKENNGFGARKHGLKAKDAWLLGLDEGFQVMAS